MKVVVNRDFGGFGLSEDCLKHMGIPYEVKDWGLDYEEDFKRDDPRLVKAVEELGSDKASGKYAKLEIVEVPDNLKHWHIHEYDGSESIYASESEILWF